MNFESFCLSQLGLVPNTVSKTLTGWLEEDCGHGDVTLLALGAWAAHPCIARVVAKQELVVCGNNLAAEVFRLAHGMDSSFKVMAQLPDGAAVGRGAVVLEVEGLAAALLAGERTALNLMSRLSGIATYTNRICEKLELCKRELETNGSSLGPSGKTGAAASESVRVPQLLETRKTTPGLKVYEKYATRVGGARNHRFALDSGAMLKENHFRAAAKSGQGFAETILKLRNNLPLLSGLEIEVTNIAELVIALQSRCEVVMLDNFSTEDIAIAVETRNKLSPATLLELSGNLDRIDPLQLVTSGVDLMSMGALVHQAPWVDLSLQFETPVESKPVGPVSEGRI